MFLNKNDQNKVSLPIEMPIGLFHQAINTAYKMSELLVKYEGSLEDIPALKMICDWWNIACPDSELRRAGSFGIYVKDEEENNEWYNLSSGASFDEETLKNWFHRCAVPYGSSNVILEFFAYKADFLITGNECTSIMVDGDTEKTVDIECADEAWESYLGLLQFEDVLAQDDERKFDEAINALKKGEEVIFELVIPGL
jgi:hypothetical protein